MPDLCFSLAVTYASKWLVLVITSFFYVHTDFTQLLAFPLYSPVSYLTFLFGLSFFLIRYGLFCFLYSSIHLAFCDSIRLSDPIFAMTWMNFDEHFFGCNYRWARYWHAYFHLPNSFLKSMADAHPLWCSNTNRSILACRPLEIVDTIHHSINDFSLFLCATYVAHQLLRYHRREDKLPRYKWMATVVWAHVRIHQICARCANNAGRKSKWSRKWERDWDREKVIRIDRGRERSSDNERERLISKSRVVVGEVR